MTFLLPNVNEYEPNIMHYICWLHNLGKKLKLLRHWTFFHLSFCINHSQYSIWWASSSSCNWTLYGWNLLVNRFAWIALIHTPVSCDNFLVDLWGLSTTRLYISADAVGLHGQSQTLPVSLKWTKILLTVLKLIGTILGGLALKASGTEHEVAPTFAYKCTILLT